MKKLLKSIPIAVMAMTGISGAASAADEIRLTLNWLTAGAHAPIYYAKSKGWFKDADIDITIEQGQGSSVAAQKVGAGASQMGIADLGSAMIARGSGADLVAVMNIFANSPYNLYWLKSSGIKTVTDFKGRTLGNPPGDAARTMWPAVAQAAGMKADDVKWVSIAPNAKVSALKSGSVEGTTFFANYHYIMAGVFGDDLGYVALRDLGLNPYGNSFVVNGDFLKSNPDAVKRAVGVLQKAYRYCTDHGEECVAVLPEYSSGLKTENEIQNWNAVVELMTDETSQSKGLGFFDPERVKKDLTLVETYFEIKKPFEADAMYTNSFIDTSVTMP